MRMSEHRFAPAYRPDIDGLRALAVIAVVLYHAQVPSFGGGYVGVDVFFVISGYLITRLLAGSGATPLRLPWSEFYLRRARRILPALLLVSLVATVAAIAILLPFDLPRFGKYLAASSVFLSNIPELTERVGYLNSRLAYTAITHYWSIAVEEQFYLVYPLALYLIGRYLPQRRTATLAILAIASLLLCILLSYHRPLSNFYLTPTRAWELLLGAVVAGNASHWFRRRLINDVLAILALLSLGIVVHWYGNMTRYPGLYTLVPCLATALLIVTGQQRSALVSRVLSLRPLVFTGLISYSLYLWHLPLLVFFGYYYIVPLGPVAMAGLLAALYLLATLSFRLVEKPIRNRSILKSNRAFIWCALVTNAIVFTAGVVLWNSDGFPKRFPPKLRIADQAWIGSRGGFLQCLQRSMNAVARGQLCSLGPQDDSAPRALVWGDSHAMALLPAYRQLAEQHGIRIYLALKAGCRPLLGMVNTSYDQDWQVGCLAFNDAVASAIEILKPRVVILNAHWIDVDADLGPAPKLAGGPPASNFSRGLEQTLRAVGAAHATACVVLDVPAFKYDLPYALDMASYRGISVDFLQLTRGEALAQYRGPERDFHLLEQRGMLTTVDTKDLLCRGDSCAYEADGELLYSDWDHLSARGALFVAGAVDGCLRGAAAGKKMP
jgi:peptidoglycan/LPS O-acetylase OafA/YrhL